MSLSFMQCLQLMLHSNNSVASFITILHTMLVVYIAITVVSTKREIEREKKSLIKQQQQQQQLKSNISLRSMLSISFQVRSLGQGREDCLLPSKLLKIKCKLF
jgi:predicted Co/Zn/Cd cation transporter (cation efflux family)